MADFFFRCKNCKRCCSCPDEPIDILICAHEPKLRQYLAVGDSFTIEPHEPCRFFGGEGCTLGSKKPFHCRLYPLAVLPDGLLGIDRRCPYANEYVLQLCVPRSDAYRHLEKIKKEIRLLNGEERRILCDWAQKHCNAMSFPGLRPFRI